MAPSCQSPALKFEYIRVGVFYPLHMPGDQLGGEHAAGKAISTKAEHSIATRQFPDGANCWKPRGTFAKTASPSIIRAKIDIRENALCLTFYCCDFFRNELVQQIII